MRHEAPALTSSAGLPNPDFQTDAILLELRRELRALQTESPPAAPASEPLGADALGTAVQELQRRSVITPRPFVSGFPVLGGAIATFRTLWNDVATRWYLQPLLQQQAEFNASVVRFAQVISQTIRLMQPDQDQEEDIARRDRQEVALARSLAQLEILLSNLQRDLKRMDDQGSNANVAALDARLTRLEGMQTSSSVEPAPPVALPPSVPFDYFGFELQFRGDPGAIKGRQRLYLDYFEKGPVLDLGCGRGEFVELLVEQGLEASGVDADAGMVAYCRQRGLDVTRNDLLSALAGQVDASLGGIFSAQTIEHLAPEDVAALIRLSFRKLAPGGVLVIETINPTCLTALSATYTLDLTHRQPVHPETAAFLAKSSGFPHFEIRYLSPVPDHLRLQVFPPVDRLKELEPWRSTLNANVQRLNEVLFGYQDYALIARKATPAGSEPS